eukprot:6594622-Prymnesium_polylepis.1
MQRRRRRRTSSSSSSSSSSSAGEAACRCDGWCCGAPHSRFSWSPRPKVERIAGGHWRTRPRASNRALFVRPGGVLLVLAKRAVDSGTVIQRERIARAQTAQPPHGRGSSQKCGRCHAPRPCTAGGLARATSQRRLAWRRAARRVHGCHLDRHIVSGEAEATVQGISKVETRMPGQAETLSG